MFSIVKESEKWNNKKKIAVLIPCYNEEATISTARFSALSQIHTTMWKGTFKKNFIFILSKNFVYDGN
ncbi:hypothetical protein EFP6CTSP_19315 [Enterococcus faecium]|nr:hypothetical protein EFP6CTSP_19315 [Enterococcus faecium]